jgi:tetratricopeptide (TPR) repeat protein
MAASAVPRGVQQTSWTDRITAPFKRISLPSFGDGAASKQARVVPIEEPFDPNKATPELYVGLAQMSHRAGNVPQARSLYQKALAKDANHLEALLGAARMEDREGQLDVALMLYKRATAAHPRNATALNDLGLCHARRGELVAAHHVLEQAVQLDPARPLYRNNVAKVLVELNGIDHAMRHLAAGHPPAVANYNMAVLLSERGRNQEAAHYLEQALAVDPQMEPARTMLAQHMAPPVMVVDGGPQMIMPTAPSVAATVPEPSDSILPTPEAIATVPWKPSDSSPSSAYPVTGTTVTPMFPGLSSPPAGATEPMPALLPPLR